MWRGLRYLMPRWKNCLFAVTVLGCYLAPLDPGLSPEHTDELVRAGSGAPAGPPPGHPERLVAHQPLSPAERELWAALSGIRQPRASGNAFRSH
jgi:hypothetical protein